MSTPASSAGGTSLQPLNAISNVPGLINFGASHGAEDQLHAARRHRLGADSGNTSVNVGFAMANDVLYDNLGILSLPPQVQQTCDVNDRPTADRPAPGQRPGSWLPAACRRAPIPITDRNGARALTTRLHSQPDIAVFGNLDGSAFSTSSPTSTRWKCATSEPAASTCRCRPT